MIPPLSAILLLHPGEVRFVRVAHIVTFLAVLALARPALAEGSFDIENVGYLETGTPNAVAVDGDYLFAGLGRYLLVIDVSDPIHPARVASTLVGPPYGYIEGIEVVGRYVFVSLGGDGLLVYDVSDPLRSALVGALGDIVLRDFAVTGNTIVGAGGARELNAIDITNPTAPTLISSLTLSTFCRDVVAQGPYAYVAGSNSGAFLVVDVSDPADMTEVGSLQVGAVDFGIDVEGDLVYVPTWSRDLAIVDVSDPSAPVEVGRYTSPTLWFRSVGVVVGGGIAVVLDEEASIDVVDVGDPANPVRVAQIDDDVGCFHAVLAGERVYTADTESSFRVIDVSVPSEAAVVGRYEAMEGIRGVALDGTTGYACDVLGWLWTLDLEDPAAPGLVPRSGVGYGVPTTMCLGDSILVVGTDSWNADASHTGITLFEIDEVGNIYPLSYSYGFYSVFDVDIEGDYIYGIAAGQPTGMFIYDVSNPLTPVQKSVTETRTPILRAIDVEGDRAYIAENNAGLAVFDVSEPTAPVQLSTYGAGASFDDVVVSGDLAYAAVPDTGLLVMDVSDPSVPVVRARVRETSQPTLLALAGSYIVTASWHTSDLVVVDVSDPAHPAVVSTYLSGPGRKMAVDGTLIAFVDDRNSLALLRADFLGGTGRPSPPPFSLRQNYPNPFNPTTTIEFTLPRATRAELGVFDVTGSRVATIVHGTVGPGPTRFQWDGTDDRGHAVPSGVYFYRLSALGRSAVRKMVLVR